MILFGNPKCLFISIPARVSYYSFPLYPLPLASCLAPRPWPRGRRPPGSPTPKRHTAAAQSPCPLSHIYPGLLLLIEQKEIIGRILHLIPENEVFSSPSYQGKAFPTWAGIGQNSKFHWLHAKPTFFSNFYWAGPCLPLDPHLTMY